MPSRKKAASKPKPSSISKIVSRQVLDSRGNPTVETDVWLKSGAFGRGTVPSGASTGVHEALELRDGDGAAYGGKSVLRAVSNVNRKIASKIAGMDATNQQALDQLMLDLDGTPNKSKLGANAILSVSMALARSAAASKNVSLFRYLEERKRYALPIPMLNVINGGKHAGNNLAVQEFLIEPVGAKNFPEGLRHAVEVYHSLKSVLKEKYGVSAINVGDEGGYAPPLQNTAEAIEAILSAISKSGYDESDIKLGLDAAASNFYDENRMTYQIDGRELTSGSLEDYYESLVTTYPILTLEDPFAEESYEDFAGLTARLGSKVKIIGDDIYVTNVERLKKGIQLKSTNAVLIKLNQIGTVTETLNAIMMAKKAKFTVVVSHRSGETEDTFISHLATAVESSFIKTGAPARGERTAKYNELLRIHEELGTAAQYAGSKMR